MKARERRKGEPVPDEVSFTHYNLGKLQNRVDVLSHAIIVALRHTSPQAKAVIRKEFQRLQEARQKEVMKGLSSRVEYQRGQIDGEAYMWGFLDQGLSG